MICSFCAIDRIQENQASVRKINKTAQTVLEKLRCTSLLASVRCQKY